MATQPINYLAMFPQQDFLRDIQGGLQLGVGLRQIQDQRAAQERALALQQQYEQDTQSAMANPTPQAFAALAVKYPQHREAFKQGWETLSADQQAVELRDMTTLAATLKSNRPDVAIKKIDERITRMKNTGQPTDQLQFLRDQVEKDPRAAYGSVLQVLSGVPGGDKALTNLISAEKAPAELEKAEEEAKIKKVEAKFAQPKAEADIGLTRAQTEQAKKAAEKLGGEIEKAAQDMATGGAIDPEKRFDFESKLRREYSDQTKTFRDTDDAYQRILATQEQIKGMKPDDERIGVNDLALIVSYAKMIDPGSVVREGEVEVIRKTESIPGQLWSLYTKAIAGDKLTESQRSSIVGLSKNLHEAAKKREKTVRAGIEQVVKSYKLNPDNVFYEPGEAAAPGQAPAPAAAPSKYQGRAWMKY